MLSEHMILLGSNFQKEMILKRPIHFRFCFHMPVEATYVTNEQKLEEFMDLRFCIALKERL